MDEEDKTEIIDSGNESQINDKRLDFNAKKEQDSEIPQKIFGKIVRVADRKDRRPKFVNICPICEKVCHNLVEHVQRNHKGTDWRRIETPCPFEDCDKVLVDIQNHITKVHLKVKNFGCDLCGANFNTGSQMKKHRDLVHSKLGEKRVKCAQCDTMLKVTSMKWHIRNVHNKEVVKRVACSEKDCPKTFLSKADMERHVENIHMDIKFPCPDCGKRFGTYSLESHVKTVHQKIYPFNCQQCGKGFQNQKHMHIHIRTKHNGDFVTCEVLNAKGVMLLNAKGVMCGKKLSNEEALQMHIKRVHIKMEGEKKVICPECEIKVLQENLQRHIDEVHLKINQKSCTVENCRDILTNKYSLKKHVDKVHNKIVTREWCDICMEFKPNLNAHMRQIHMDHELVPCTWPQCSYQAKTLKALQLHFQNIHESKPRVKCDECGKSVKDLYSHKKWSHRRVESHICQKCDKGFPGKYRLREHLNKIHLKLRSTCPDCGVEVAAGYLANHKRIVHEKKKVAACNIPGCSTTFPSNGAKKTHIEKVHEKIRESCPECGKQVSNLKVHIKVVHKKERPYQCPECEKTYKIKTHLKNHIKTFHLGLRVKCEECGKMVTDIYAHRFHQHRETDYSCDECKTTFKSSTGLKVHILTVHMGAKDHCEICDKDISVGRLKKHIERVHQNKTEKCPKCGLVCKDLYRHTKYTDCESGTYILKPRKICNVAGRTLKKHIKRVHQNIKEKCPNCGLVCKNLYSTLTAKVKHTFQNSAKFIALEEQIALILTSLQVCPATKV